MAAGSISERAENGEGDGEGDELFPMGSVDGDGKPPKARVPGADVQTLVKIKAAEVPARGGFDPRHEGKLLVTFEVGKEEETYIREEGKVKRVKMKTHLTPIHVERVDASTADIEAAFELLLDGDASEAGKLLDKLKRRAQKVLATA